MRRALLLVVLLAGCHSPTAPAPARIPKPHVHRVQHIEPVPLLDSVTLTEHGGNLVLDVRYEPGSTYGLDPGQWTLQLFIDSDDADTTGYAGYERLVNGYAPVPGGLTIYDVSHTDTTGWGPVTGIADLQVHPQHLTLRIPKAALNLQGGFDWALETYCGESFNIVRGSGQVTRVGSPRRVAAGHEADQLGFGDGLQP